MIVIVINLDFKRAFETIGRNKFLRKLHKYDIKGDCLKWFQKGARKLNVKMYV